VVWELVFMLVLLKIPLVYLCMVVWWAIKAEPREEPPTTSVQVSDTPAPHAGWSRPATGGRPEGGRRGARPRPVRRARERAEASR
jgi:hypothetical protein